MSDVKTIRNPSPLVMAILSLDEHFQELTRLGARIEEMDLKSDFDLEQNEKLTARFAECGHAISTDIANFVQVLNVAREQAETTAQIVFGKVEQLKGRKDNVQEKMNQFQTLSEKVGRLNESLLKIKPQEGDILTDSDRVLLTARLAEVESELQDLIEEAQELKEVGQNSKIKVLEQNADSMRQTLIAVSQKLKSIRPQN